jgi:hypothetical protein
MFAARNTLAYYYRPKIAPKQALWYLSPGLTFGGKKSFDSNPTPFLIFLGD